MKIIMLLLTILMAGSALAVADSAAPEADLNVGRWQGALDAGDFEALADLYSLDAVMVPPSLEIVSERDAIRRFWTERRSSGTRDFRINPVNVRSDGARLVQTAEWSAIVISNGQAGRQYGEMTNVLVRQPDGNWKIQMQSWN
jgi:uncharacterized protein (TIGR02246 family)